MVQGNARLSFTPPKTGIDGCLNLRILRIWHSWMGEKLLTCKKFRIGNSRSLKKQFISHAGTAIQSPGANQQPRGGKGKLYRRTMVENSQEYRQKCWATRSSVRSFARSAHSFACCRLLASLAPSTALTRTLALSLCSLPRSWESEFSMSQNDLVLSHSAPPRYGVINKKLFHKSEEKMF